MKSSSHFLHWILAAAFLVATPLLLAQQAASAQRGDGQATPLLVYEPSPAVPGCAPLAIISHGAGGSELGYAYLARAMSNAGYRTIVMGHRESGMNALRLDMLSQGFMPGLKALVGNPAAESARMLDVGAALQWANSQCSAPFRVLLGHSMGAETVMLEAGAKNKLIAAPPAGQDRFDAYVALSPEGPGIVFPKHAWSGIHKPMLVMTGTRDQALEGKPEDRKIPWQDLPGTKQQCQWLAVLDGATHLNFAGNGPGSLHVEESVVATVGRFLQGVRQGACTMPAPEAGMQLQIK